MVASVICTLEWFLRQPAGICTAGWVLIYKSLSKAIPCKHSCLICNPAQFSWVKRIMCKL